MQLISEFINAPANLAVSHHLSHLWTIAVIFAGLGLDVGVIGLIVFALTALLQLARYRLVLHLRLRRKHDTRDQTVFLELTFPSVTTKSAFATSQLHILLRGQTRYRSFLERLAGEKKRYSLELVATRDEGIRYLMMVPRDEAETVSRSLLSFLPGLKIRETGDYLPELTGTPSGVVELKLGSHFALPLKSHEILGEHDPIAHIAGQMTKLAPAELVGFQVVVSPVHKSTHAGVSRQARGLRGRIARGQALSPKLASWQQSNISRVWRMTWYVPMWIMVQGIKFLAAIPMLFIDHRNVEAMYLQPTRRDTLDAGPYELELGQIVKAKLDQQLFEVSLRIIVASPITASINNRLDALISSFATFSSPNQSLKVRRGLPFLNSPGRGYTQFMEREHAVHINSASVIISSSELSDLYHFPNTDLTKTEGLVKSRSQELPAPLSLKSTKTDFDIVVGSNTYGGEASPIGLTLDQRQKHTYVIGKTGMGKTTLLTSAIYQDMLSGKGLAVFDPHGDMFQELLQLVPENRLEDVVVFDPSDRDWPIGLNLLDPGIDFDNETEKHEWITSTVISVFEKLSDKQFWGPRMEYILRYATLTALHQPNPTLYTLQRLLTDKQYQKEVALTLKDPVLKQFWLKEFIPLGSMQMTSATAPLTHRLGHFISTTMSRHMLLQQKTTMRISDVMNEGKILLINLSKGDLGEDESTFFGTILTSYIWMAAYQRTKIPESQRRDFFVYVDEFQNFATPRFSEIMSEGRKYHVSLILSHQNVAQIEDQNLLKVISGNASTIISLSVGPDDEAFVLPFMKPEVEKGDIMNLPPYHFYMKATNIISEAAFSGQTALLDAPRSPATKVAVVARSRNTYGVPVATVEAYLEQLFAATVAKPPAKRAQPAGKQTAKRAPAKTPAKVF
jgi:hypothetical protein